MKNFDENLVLETINMIKLYNLDIRTVTMAISLRDCIDRDVNTLCKRIREKILRHGSNLVKYAQEVGDDYAIPIVNKRIAVTPISIIGESCNEYDYVKIAHTLDDVAKEIGVDFVGGYSALVEKGCTKGDIALIKSIPEALATTSKGRYKYGCNIRSCKNH